jgi:hypothetical protein
MRSPAFVTEAHRQSLAVAKSPHAKEDQDFIDAVSDWGAVWSAAKSGPLQAARTMLESPVQLLFFKTTVEQLLHVFAPNN